VTLHARSVQSISMARASIGSLDVPMGDFVLAAQKATTIDTCQRGAHGGQDRLFTNRRVASVFF
jgi:hypothetical protein